MTDTAAPDRTARRANVESILPLLPNQSALLLARGLREDDPGFIQVTFTLTGDLDTDRYAAAWRSTVARHPGLRSSVRARDGADPLVVVWRDVELPLEVLDLRPLDAADRRARLAELLAADRRLGLDPAVEPVNRVQIARVDDDRWEVVWSCHHLFVDGWSAAVVLEDVIAAYRALSGLAPPPAPAAYGDVAEFVRWVRDGGAAGAQAFWQQRLAGYRGAPRFALGSPDPDAPGYGELTVALDRGLVDQVAAAAAGVAATPNAFAQGAWALVVARILDTDDVVFGTTVAGRAAPVAGIERLVGYVSNAVPIRMRIEPGRTLASWLQDARDAQFALQPFEHTPPASIHDWSDVPGHRELYETFLVVANYPFREAGPTRDPAGLLHSDFDSGLTAAFPLTVAIGLGDPGFVRCQYELSRCSPDAAEGVVAGYVATLGAMAATPHAPLDALLGAGAAGPVPAVLDLADHEVNRPPFRAPGDEIERRLAELWEETLGIGGIGVDDDYFALGGTSVAAVRLFGLIEEALGKRLPLSALLSGATIAHLARLVRGEDAPRREWEHLVPIQPTGDQPPIVCLHASTGEVLFYRSLAGRLGDDQPVYGVEPLGLDGTQLPLESIPEMAARYVDELRSLQPEGPYRLVGYCFGCTVALEMARQLEAGGERVGLLAMVDPPLLHTGTRAERAAAIRRERGNAAVVVAGLRRVGQLVAGAVRRHAGRRWDRRFGGSVGRRRLNQEIVRDACSLAADRYQPQPVTAPITLIRSNDERLRTSGLPKQWRAISPGLRDAQVDSGHGGMLDEPAVAAVAQIIVQEMARGGT